MKEINNNFIEIKSIKNISRCNYIINIGDIENINDSSVLFKILLNIMEKLRSKSGCIWDKEQTHQSIKRNLIEEAYEAAESIEEENFEDLKEEIGDILLQVVFHSQIAKEQNNFNINDVLKTIIKKLIRRHPHVFKDIKVSDSKDILKNWEQIKKEERKLKYNSNKIKSNNFSEDLSDSQSIFYNIPKMLPALHYAHEIQNRASRLDFDWPDTNDILKKIEEEVKELKKAYEETFCIVNPRNIADNIQIDKNKIQDKTKIDKLSEEIGDLLFSIVNLCRHLKIDAEESLKKTCKKFIKRFNYMQEYSEDNNLDFKNLSINKKDEIWELAKKKIKED